jgi:hypothetical protein
MKTKRFRVHMIKNAQSPFSIVEAVQVGSVNVSVRPDGNKYQASVRTAGEGSARRRPT